MKDKECDQIFEYLKEKLMAIKLSWIVEQVEEDIRIGKLSEEKPDSRKSIFDFPFDKNINKKSKHKMPHIIEYSAKDKLNLLLNAIEQAMVNIPLIEMNLLQSFNDYLNKSISITFHSEDPNIRSFDIVEIDAHINTDLGKRFKELLDILSVEIKND